MSRLHLKNILGQFQDDDSCGSIDSSPSSEKENMFIQNFMSHREVGILARNMVSKNILTNLSSAHIRQFVSPFFKNPVLPQSPKIRIQKIKIKTNQNKNSKNKRNQSSASSSATGSLSLRKNKNLKILVDRLCLPTQNCLMKTIKEVCSLTSKKVFNMFILRNHL